MLLPSLLLSLSQILAIREKLFLQNGGSSSDFKKSLFVPQYEAMAFRAAATGDYAHVKACLDKFPLYNRHLYCECTDEKGNTLLMLAAQGTPYPLYHTHFPTVCTYTHLPCAYCRRLPEGREAVVNVRHDGSKHAK